MFPFPVLNTSLLLHLVTRPLGSWMLYDLGGRSGEAGSNLASLHTLSCHTRTVSPAFGGFRGIVLGS